MVYANEIDMYLVDYAMLKCRLHPQVPVYATVRPKAVYGNPYRHRHRGPHYPGGSCLRRPPVGEAPGVIERDTKLSNPDNG